jgi:signal transduction histidine kinase
MQARRAALLSDPEKKQQIFDSIGATASQTLQDLRSLLVVLKPPTDDDSVTVTSVVGDPVLDTPEVSGETTTAVGFLEDFNDVVEALQRSSLSVEKNIDGDTETIPMSQRQTLRRIVRELATNVLKHGAPGSRVSLNLKVDSDFVVMSMENVISEAEPIMSSQTGLEAIKARAEVFGGVVSSGSEDGTLWKTTVMLPLAGLDGGASFSLAQDGVGMKHPGEAYE